MKKRSLCFPLVLVVVAGQVAPALAQGGDQFLDGIGETALVARYVFNGNERDASRNTFHATLQGTGGAYVEDPQFGRVLSLHGGRGAYVRIPGQALDGLDTISVSAWPRSAPMKRASPMVPAAPGMFSTGAIRTSPVR